MNNETTSNSPRENNIPALRERFGDRVVQKGQEAFATYSFAVSGLTWDGKPIPKWEELTDKIRLAWVMAANAVLSE